MKEKTFCIPFTSDGTWTIGYIDGEPAEWSGNMEVITKKDSYTVKSEGTTFGVNCQDEFIVKDGQWVENINDIEEAYERN